MLNNLMIKGKLRFLSGGLIVAIIITGVFGILQLMSSNQRMSELYTERLLSIKLLDTNRAHARAISAELFDLILSEGNDTRTDKIMGDMDRRLTEFYNNLEEYKATNLDEEEKAILPVLEENLTTYRGLREQILKQVWDGEYDQALINIRATETASEAFQQNLIDLALHNEEMASSLYTKNQESFNSSIILMGIVMGLSILIGTILTFVISGSISKPLSKVVDHIGEIAQYDISHEVPGELLTRKDEIGVLALSVDKIGESLRQIIGNINEHSQQVAASAEELTATSQQASSSAEEVSRTIEEIARGAGEQAKDTETVAMNIQEMGTSLDEDALYVSNMSDAIAEITSQKEEGIVTIQNLTQKTKENYDSSGLIYDIIIKNNDNAEKIDTASSMIQNIADQTNLLALNAAIEAARAGEAGRGFAVVADEIRKLAEQSTNFTEDIKSVIQELKNSSNEAVKNMLTVKSIVENQSESVQETEKQFGKISDSIDSMKEVLNKLTHSSESMTHNKDQVVDLIQNLSAISQQNAAGTQEASASMEEQTATMAEIAHAGESMAEISTELQSVVNQFKL